MTCKTQLHVKNGELEAAIPFLFILLYMLLTSFCSVLLHDTGMCKIKTTWFRVILVKAYLPGFTLFILFLLASHVAYFYDMEKGRLTQIRASKVQGNILVQWTW